MFCVDERDRLIDHLAWRNDVPARTAAFIIATTWTQQATVIVEDQSHPATAALGERFSVLEEFYTFRDNPRPRVQVLLRLDSTSVGSTGDYPLAWVQSYGSGRVYHNALGHFSNTWNDRRFQQQLIGAVRWAAAASPSRRRGERRE
jgi:type 1 glutamine amidotransferase